jgi:hypothetical protein
MVANGARFLPAGCLQIDSSHTNFWICDHRFKRVPMKEKDVSDRVFAFFLAILLAWELAKNGKYWWGCLSSRGWPIVHAEIQRARIFTSRNFCGASGMIRRARTSRTIASISWNQNRPGIFSPARPGRPLERLFIWLASSSSTRREASLTAARMRSCNIS